MNKKNNILLTISLIVKNEEANLPKCLDSLKPIMEAIPCQLIITDTGSTDKTVEIAKDYTEEVYFFEWCDDFAAARNSGLQKASGEWFMFIDADEWFEDCNDLIDFFKSGEYINYKNATYIARNYVNKSDINNFEDQALGRLFKRTDKTKFKGIIHEAVEFSMPIKELKSYVNHYGYASDNPVIYKEIKTQRNMKLLLKEYQQNPEDDRISYLLAIEYASIQNRETFRQHIKNKYDKIKEDYDNEFLPYFVYQLALIYKDEGKYEKGLNVLNKYKKSQKKKEIWNLDIIVAIIDLYLRNKQYEEAVKYGQEFFKLFEKFKKGQLNTGLSGIVSRPTFINDESSVTVTNLMAQAYLYLDNYNRAIELVMELDFNIVIFEDLKDIFKIVFYVAFKEKQWSLLPELYTKVLKLNNFRKGRVFAEMLEDNVIANIVEFESVVNVFIEFTDLINDFPQDEYLMLQELRYCILKQQDLKTKGIVKEFINNNLKNTIDPIFSEFVFFALNMPEYTDDILNKIDIENLNLYTKKLIAIYNILPYNFIIFFTSLDKLKLDNNNKRFNYWVICMLENILINSKSLEKQVMKDLIHIYIDISYQYMLQIYNHQILCENEINILPRSFRFIFYMHEAQNSLKHCNKQGYVSYLKKALIVYPIMLSVVNFLLESIDENVAECKINQEKNKEDFDFYATNVKKKIKELATNKDMRDEAIKLFVTYSKINPKDEVDIAKLRLLLMLEN